MPRKPRQNKVSAAEQAVKAEQAEAAAKVAAEKERLAAEADLAVAAALAEVDAEEELPQMKVSEPKVEEELFVRVKKDGFIFRYNEQLAANPACEVVPESVAFPKGRPPGV